MVSLEFILLTDLSVQHHSVPNPSHSPSSAHFSAADFFRDSPWLNIPAHRKADIMIEPLYPRLGLLGGAPQGDGKVSKLAALAAARKKKESNKRDGVVSPSAHSKDASSPAASLEMEGGGSMSLQERLSATRKDAKPPEQTSGLSALKNHTRNGSRGTKSREIAAKTESASTKLQKTTEPIPRASHTIPSAAESPASEPITITPNIRATPSTFASTIIGSTTNSSSNEPSHSLGRSFDVMTVYGQDLTEAFDFSGPSPDDVVLNAQSASKGLPIRGAI